ncbi:Ferredoxin-NADP(+) reductase [hydrothermal vent metagenome]|uniref:Ferredoxin-NADP(+) reductase n=1 Tax=hydrothermal vent metagenome TaxID=652676 RepID=A0A3B1E678_9ZZZZ
MTTNATKDPGPTLPAVEMHIHKPNDPTIGIVVENRLCTKGGRKAAGFVRHIVLDISKTDIAGRFRAGQAFGVIPPGQDAKGKPHKVRLYSIASPTGGEDGSGTLLATTVKRMIDENWDDQTLFLGVASNWLCDRKVGDEVPITGPAGKRFLLPASPNDHDYAFFATGTGIAPFRGMVQELLAGGVTSQIVLVLGSPYATDLLYHDEMTALAEQHDNFTYLTALSREPQPDGSGRMYVQDRLETHTELFERVLGGDRGLVYACGLAGMEIGILQGLSRTLGPERLARYVTVEAELAGDPAAWDRKMIPRRLTPTRRLFLEVY